MNTRPFYITNEFDGKDHWLICSCGWRNGPYQFTTVKQAATDKTWHEHEHENEAHH